MEIRSLDTQENKLSVFRQPDGDIQVTIRHDTGNYKDSCVLGVRIGGPGSGHSVPPDIMQLLHQLATAFEKYNECRTESEAFEKYINKEDNKKIPGK